MGENLSLDEATQEVETTGTGLWGTSDVFICIADI